MTPTRRAVLTLFAAAPMAAMTAQVAHAQGTPPVYAESGIAIVGSDPVAYFTESAPTVGDPDITYDWNGATWRFVSAANRDAFAANPEAHASQYGGYCASAVSEGYTASTVPEAWRIMDGKLYINFSRGIQRRLERDIPGRIATGDANWPEVLG